MTNDLDLDRDLRDVFLRHEKDLLGRSPTPAPSMLQRIRRRQTGTVLMGAVVTAAIAIASISGLDAIRAPGQMPASSDPAPTALDPFISIQAQLDQQVPIDLFRVRADRAAYWRLYALDQFDGSVWTSSDPEAQQRGQVLTTPAELPLVEPIPQDAPVLVQSYEMVRDIDGRWLPMAAHAESITVSSGEVTYDQVLSQALLDGGLDEGFEYTVTSRIVNPAPEALDDVVFLAPEQYGRYTEVPSSADPRVRELAERWTRDEDTPYREIYAIQQRFLDGSFSYGTDAEPMVGADALLDFLTVSRRGFCQQFATAMAVMVRELGYPARIAVGYRSGTLEDGVFTVRTTDAHAWVEVYFRGHGWLAFEPTPGRPNPIAEAGSYLNP